MTVNKALLATRLLNVNPCPGAMLPEMPSESFYVTMRSPVDGPQARQQRMRSETFLQLSAHTEERQAVRLDRSVEKNIDAMEMLASDAGAVRARLLSEGLPYITTNARLRERFAEYLQTTPAQKYARCVSRVGWYERTYVLPNGGIGPAGNEEILYQTPNGATHNWNTRGDAGQWREHVGQRCGGNSRLILAASSGFAGPLLSVLGAESGGVHFHGGSSKGKTTALIVGGSVCGGGGQQGFVETWRTTINGLEAMAEAHNDGTLFLDELSQADPRDVAEAAYLLEAVNCSPHAKLS